MSKTVLKSLFAQKSWANGELFEVLATAAPSTPAGPLQTALRTLNHIYVVDRIFRSHLKGETHGYAATNTTATPELGALNFAVAETDLWFEDYLAGVSDASLTESLAFRFTDGDAGRMTREEMLTHVITHGAYHRGNVGQVLKSIEITPPRDLFTKFLHLRESARRQA